MDRLRHKCVIIVDDNAAVRHALRRLFENAGWEVCAEACDGQQAISLVLQFRPQVVVIDLSMPVMNGFAAARILKESAPECRLILFSGFAGLLSVEQLRSGGFSAVVSKEHPGTLISQAESLLDVA